MDWSADGEGVREQLLRIVALLIGLSVLAERSSRAPHKVRLTVLGLLRTAEQVGSRFIAGEVAIGGEVAAAEPVGDDAAAAMRLAARFRALAIALTTVAGRLGGGGRVGPGVGPKVSIGIAPARVKMASTAAGQGRARLRPFDTS